MKYKRMLCWVRQQDKEELLKECNDIPLKFVSSIEEFEKEIKEDDYLIMSLAFMGLEINSFVQKFPKNIFNLFCLGEDEEQTHEQTQVMFEPNVTDGQYISSELKENFLGKIENLWEYRLYKNPTRIVIK